MIDFPSSDFHPVCVGDKRKNRCPECLHIIFHYMAEFFLHVFLQEIYTVNTLREGERLPKGMSSWFFFVIFFFFLSKENLKALMKMNNPH